VRITDVRIVDITFPPVNADRLQSLRRRPLSDAQAERAFPIALHPKFSRTVGEIPGSLKSDFWVQILAEDGTWGLGQGLWGDPVRAVIERYYAPLLLGEDCFAIEYLNDIMWRVVQSPGDTGFASVARSAVDLALWDLKGKLLGQPVYSLLGGPVRDSVPVYCTNDDFEWVQELGFTRVKISNPVHHTDGQDGLRRIEEHVSAAREALGDAAEIMFNPVMSFNVSYSLRVAETIRPYGLRWMEQPLMTWDTEGMAELKRAVTWIELATGEDHHGRHAFRRLLEQRAVDVVQPDLLRCGGMTELMKIYHLAESFGVVTIPHTGANNAFGQHAAMAMPESPMAEFQLRSDPGVPLSLVERVPGVAVPQNGQLNVSDAPGFGLAIPADWITPVTSAA
jgi:L-rhamnonate dehydratase